VQEDVLPHQEKHLFKRLSHHLSWSVYNEVWKGSYQPEFWWGVPGIGNTDKTKNRRKIKMVRKLFVLAIFFAVLCSAGVGCFRGRPYVGGYDAPYYDGPYRIGEGSYHYYNGGFYVYDGGKYRFHHDAPQDQRGYYDERYREHYEQYHRDHPKSQNQHPEHPEQSPRQEDRRE
jgi:hypothetical protein